MKATNKTKISIVLWLLAGVFGVSAQIVPNAPKTPVVDEAKKKRSRIVKDDVLRDVKTLPADARTEFYGDLGGIWRTVNPKEANLLLEKAVALALAPSTKFDSVEEKFNLIYHLLWIDKLVETNYPLAKRLAEAIPPLLETETDPIKADQDARALLTIGILFAEIQDSKTARLLGALALRLRKKSYGYTSLSFLMRLKRVDRELAAGFFRSQIEWLEKSDNADFIGIFVGEALVDNRRNIDFLAGGFDETEIGKLLALGTSAIERESAELAANRINHCRLAKNLGRPLLSFYDKYLTDNREKIEKALAVCRAAAIDEREKPDYRDVLAETSDYWLARAAGENDRKLKTRYLLSAVGAAQTEKNYARAVSILDGFDDAMKKDNLQAWHLYRLQDAAAVVSELVRAGKADEATAYLDNTTVGLRPFILLRCLEELVYRKHQKSVLHGFVERARADLKLMVFPPDPDLGLFVTINPARFQELADYYYRLGYPDEAVETFGEYVELQNQLAGRYMMRNKKGQSVAYFNYRPLSVKFVDEYFDRLYPLTGRLRNPRIRASVRLQLLAVGLGERSYSLHPLIRLD